MISVCIMLMVLTLNGPQNAIQAHDALAIEAAKNTNVRRIDPSLPEKPFEIWLRDLVGPQAEIQWEVNDCGEQTGNPLLDKGRDLPICAEAQVTFREGRKLYITLCVGTFETGIKAGLIGFLHAVIVEANGSRLWIKSLSRVPEVIKAKK